MILAACGLQREARLIARAGMVAIAGGGDAARLERKLEAALDGTGRAILSIGLAGALSPTLRVGEVVIGTSPLSHPYCHRGGVPAWLAEILPHAHCGTIVGQDTPAATPEQKRDLHATGALAVDMESHIAAHVAARHGLPFAAIRVISDDANRTLPPAALVGMASDGGMALGPVLASLARRPSQLPALIRTGIDAERAFRSLRRALRALEARGIGDLDLLEFRGDV